MGWGWQEGPGCAREGEAEPSQWSTQDHVCVCVWRGWRGWGQHACRLSRGPVRRCSAWCNWLAVFISVEPWAKHRPAAHRTGVLNQPNLIGTTTQVNISHAALLILHPLPCAFRTGCPPRPTP